MEDKETSAVKDIENLEKELEELKEATNEIKGDTKESKAVQIQQDILIRNRENMCVSANTRKCSERYIDQNIIRTLYVTSISLKRTHDLSGIASYLTDWRGFPSEGYSGEKLYGPDRGNTHDNTLRTPDVIAATFGRRSLFRGWRSLYSHPRGFY